ncbi:MAG: pyrroline-5-carboxylate reductase [Gammaproteobacteria bacterium]|jgi:pyrroline-5-carboxylate reductase
MTRIAFIGGGNMASSLIGGLIEGGEERENIVVTEPLDAQRERLRKRFGVEVTSDNIAAVRAAQTVVLAVKPQVMKNVAIEIGPSAAKTRPLLVSIAAGVVEPSLLKWLDYPASIVRCMPNTPSLVGCGASALYANEHVSDAQRKQASAILEAAGIALWVDSEDQIDAVTAVSGSGPAYFFMLMEHMITTGEALGLSKEITTRLTLQTALGAARMALEGTDSPATLRANVTSPGGTTERALSIFADAGIEDIVRRALTGARDRSRELAKDA